MTASGGDGTRARVGVIGCGSIGRRYAQWLSEAPGLEVAAHDVEAERLAPLAPAVTIFPQLPRLLAWMPSKIVVATPPHVHAPCAIAALEAGADVLVEKPIAAGTAAAAAILEAAGRTGRTVRGVCNMRFHPAVEALSAALAEIGRPLWVRAHFAHRLSQMRPVGTAVYAASAADGGGVILDCIHELDSLQWLLGPIRRVRGWTGRIGDDPIDADDVADLQVEFESGCHGVLHFDFLSRLKRRGMEIVGTDATVVWQSTGRAPESCEVIIGDASGVRVLLKTDAVDDVAPYRQMLSRFMDGGAGLQTGAEAMRALAVALAARAPEWSAP